MTKPEGEIPDPTPFDAEEWATRFESLSWADRIWFLADGGIHLLAGLVESAADEAAAVITRARRSFRQGLDPNILEAHIVEEWSCRRDSAAGDEETEDAPYLKGERDS